MRRLFIVLACLLCFRGMAKDVTHYFRTMPDEMLLTTQSMRLDLIDFYQGGIKSNVKGVFDNLLEIKSLSDNYLLLQTSEQSQWQLKVLSLNDTSEVLAVVQTVAAPAKSSRILFFTSSWKAIPSEQYPIPQPQCLDFWDLDAIDQSSIEMSISGLCENLCYEYRFMPGNDFLEICSSAPDYLSKEIYQKIASAFIGSFRCIWTGRGFERQ